MDLKKRLGEWGSCVRGCENTCRKICQSLSIGDGRATEGARPQTLPPVQGHWTRVRGEMNSLSRMGVLKPFRPSSDNGCGCEGEMNLPDEFVKSFAPKVDVL